MKAPLLILLVAVMSVLAAPVMAQPLTANLTGDCVQTYDPSLDYFPDKVAVEQAVGFEVEYFDQYKVVRVTQPWADAGIRYEYVLVQCGVPLPAVIEGIETIGYQVIEVPLRSIVTLSATFVPALEIIGELDRLVAVDETDYLYIPALRQRIDTDGLAEVGSGPTIDIERLLDLAPGAVMLNLYGSDDFDPDSILRDNGIARAVNSDYLETTPLGRAEWLKFVALFFNREAEANRFYDAMAARYADLQTLAADAPQRPTVLVNGMFDGTWYVAGGQSYIARLIADAGGSYLWADDDSTGGLALDFESVLDRAAAADVWINPNFWFTLADGLAEDERYAVFDAFQSGRVYNNNLRVTAFGGNDYYESATVNPDRLLADLIAIFHPDLLPDHAFSYYQQLP